MARVKKQNGFILIGCGDWKQIAPVDGEDNDFENAWLLKYLFNNNSYGRQRHADLTTTDCCKMHIQHQTETESISLYIKQL